MKFTCGAYTMQSTWSLGYMFGFSNIEHTPEVHMQLLLYKILVQALEFESWQKTIFSSRLSSQALGLRYPLHEIKSGQDRYHLEGTSGSLHLLESFEMFIISPL